MNFYDGLYVGPLSLKCSDMLYVCMSSVLVTSKQMYCLSLLDTNVT